MRQEYNGRQAGRQNITTAGMFTQYVWTLNEPRETWKMVLNANTLMFPAISVIRVALRGPLEWALCCLDPFHLAWRLTYALHLCFRPNRNLWKCNYWSLFFLSGCHVLPPLSVSFIISLPDDTFHADPLKYSSKKYCDAHHKGCVR